MKNDRTILKDVQAELRWDPTLDASNITVLVQNGIVSLGGTVQQYADIKSADSAAKRVKGVRAVAEGLEVFDGENVVVFPDTDIKDNISAVIRSHALLDKTKIESRVEDGWVVLEGDVSLLHRKHLTSSAISFIKGIKGVRNLICVTPTTLVKVTQESIREALDRNTQVNADRILIETKGSVVTLKGTTTTWAERDEIEKTASYAPGVTYVDDEIAVVFDIRL